MDGKTETTGSPVRPERPFVVTGIGEVLWDLLPAGRRLGGAPANFACHVARLGVESYLVSAVGDDALGKEAHRVLAVSGVSTRHLAVLSTVPTGTVGVQLSPAGIPRYQIVEKVAWDLIRCDEAETRLASRVDAACFGTLAQRAPNSRAAIRHFLALTPPGCLRILDINLRGNYFDGDLIRSSLELTNILKLNNEELPIVCRLLGGPDGEDAGLAFLLRNFGLRLVALTKGAAGCRIITPDQDVQVPGVPVARIADTVGAGDSFTAMLAIGLLARWPLTLIAERANRLAAFVCSQPGGMPVIPENVLQTIWNAKPEPSLYSVPAGWTHQSECGVPP